MSFILDHKQADIIEARLQTKGGRIERNLETFLMWKMLSPIALERALDIGCGLGLDMLFLESKGIDCTGVDISISMVERTRKRLKRIEGIYQCDGKSLDFEDNTFDLCILNHTLEFCDNPDAVLREAVRVTRRRIYVGLLNPFSFSGYYRKCLSPVWSSIDRKITLISPWRISWMLKNVCGSKNIYKKKSVAISPLWLLPYLINLEKLKPLQMTWFGSYFAATLDLAYTLRVRPQRIKTPEFKKELVENTAQSSSNMIKESEKNIS